ncbi:MAG: hypothetical protein KJ626_04095, partial [Verrucomicrobia bacterium]|nr:hypothetical protein [Verrucomicrobiota bacterium]
MTSSYSGTSTPMTSSSTSGANEGRFRKSAMSASWSIDGTTTPSYLLGVGGFRFGRCGLGGPSLSEAESDEVVAPGDDGASCLAPVGEPDVERLRGLLVL